MPNAPSDTDTPTRPWPLYVTLALWGVVLILEWVKGRPGFVFIRVVFLLFWLLCVLGAILRERTYRQYLREQGL